MILPLSQKSKIIGSKLKFQESSTFVFNGNANWKSIARLPIQSQA